jgi:hypothetical protein
MVVPLIMPAFVLPMSLRLASTRPRASGNVNVLLATQSALAAAGRIPQLYFADGQIKIRLTNKAGVTQSFADNLLVVGPSSGGGGGGIDATTILQTGDLKARSATSGATERANSDAQALFEYLWSADTTLAVSTGRGPVAQSDHTRQWPMVRPFALTNPERFPVP